MLEGSDHIVHAPDSCPVIGLGSQAPLLSVLERLRPPKRILGQELPIRCKRVLARHVVEGMQLAVKPNNICRQTTRKLAMG